MSGDALAARCFHLVWLASALQPVADCFAFASPLTAQSSDPHTPLIILLTLATILPRYPSSQVASGAALVSSLVFGILALARARYRDSGSLDASTPLPSPASGSGNQRLSSSSGLANTLGRGLLPYRLVPDTAAFVQTPDLLAILGRSSEVCPPGFRLSSTRAWPTILSFFSKDPPSAQTLETCVCVLVTAPVIGLWRLLPLHTP
ncbi:hypothetical protein DFH06DRAFT_1117928 [Mycena polygramma]|nr:hypothetical protein DFH06DRAFT_1117928 [Mycena polygramma]